MYDEISNVVYKTPIIAGIEANDQTTYDLGKVIDSFVAKGFDGFINFPTVGNEEHVSPFFVREYENIASSLGQPWGFAREVELIRLLRERDIFTMCYVFNAEQAARMAEVGVDAVCAHVGGTAGGLIGFPADPMQESLENTQRIMEGAWGVDPDVICLAPRRSLRRARRYPRALRADGRAGLRRRIKHRTHPHRKGGNGRRQSLQGP